MSGLKAALSMPGAPPIGLYSAANASGVTIFPSTHAAEPFPKYFELNSDAILRKVSPGLKYKEIFQSSFDGSNMPPAIQGSDNGLVRAAIEAYSGHRHLTLRPEDLWFAILSQTSAYVNKHAEELRSLFVAHEGKQEVRVVEYGTRHTVDFGELAHRLTKEMDNFLVDPELRGWILPNFSTTKNTDIVVASVLMMTMMQEYFTYEMWLTCGIPSVTLLGEKADYSKILQRLEKLETFGGEAKHFAQLLRPIVRRFIRSFEDPTDSEVIRFWQHIFHRVKQGSGEPVYSGWITAFCFWDKDGNRTKEPLLQTSEQVSHLELDGMTYPMVASSNVPPGWGKVPVLVNDNGVEFDAEMIAGSVGIMSSKADSKSPEQSSSRHDSVQPATGWWIYDTGKSNRSDINEKRPV